MDAQVIVKNLDGVETNNIKNINNKNDFSYKDSFGANNHIIVSEKGIRVERTTKEHTTLVYLNSLTGFVKIKSKEGEFRIDTKVVAFNIKDDIITIAYNLADDIKEITIKYLGV